MNRLAADKICLLYIHIYKLGCIPKNGLFFLLSFHGAWFLVIQKWNDNEPMRAIIVPKDASSAADVSGFCLISRIIFHTTLAYLPFQTCGFRRTRQPWWLALMSLQRISIPLIWIPKTLLPTFVPTAIRCVMGDVCWIKNIAHPLIKSPIRPVTIYEDACV